jgi:hypothetical protein
MKKVRLVLIALAAPALTLLGLHELGGTPISKGFDTGFRWSADVANHRLVLTAQAEGDLTCWLRIQIPQTSGRLSARTSTNDELRVYKEADDGQDQWIAVVKNSQAPQDKFIWASGATLYIYAPAPFRLAIHDWYLFPSNKNFDSEQRARWRESLFWIATALLILAVTGGVLEGVEHVRSKREAFSPQECVESVIRSVEGRDPAESETMRSILEKVLIGGATVEEALAPLRLSDRRKNVLWITTAGRFRTKLQFLIAELARYLERLKSTP